ncbi:hypothetical protein KKC97_06140, partial [bacterium]|nr:hypothetical protein [bacterium]
GTFKNRILSGTYFSTDNSNFERGAILLLYVKKGKFVGQQSLFSKTADKLTADELVSTKYEWNHV